MRKPEFDELKLVLIPYVSLDRKMGKVGKKEGQKKKVASISLRVNSKLKMKMYMILDKQIIKK